MMEADTNKINAVQEKDQDPKIQTQKTQEKKIQSLKMQTNIIQTQKMQEEKIQSLKMQTQKIQEKKIQSQKMQVQKIQQYKVQRQKAGRLAGLDTIRGIWCFCLERRSLDIADLEDMYGSRASVGRLFSWPASAGRWGLIILKEV